MVTCHSDSTIAMPLLVSGMLEQRELVATEGGRSSVWPGTHPRAVDGAGAGFASAEQSLMAAFHSGADPAVSRPPRSHYNKELQEPTCRSPRRVLRDRMAHCMEGAFLGGCGPAVFTAFRRCCSISKPSRDDDHVLAVYRQRGPLGRGREIQLRRLAVPRTRLSHPTRELVMSFLEHYYNPAGEKTLRGYSRPVNLSRFDNMNWATAEADLWPIAQHLCDICHTPLLTAVLARNLARGRRQAHGGRAFRRREVSLCGAPRELLVSS